jgi:hypothetical protein
MHYSFYEEQFRLHSWMGLVLFLYNVGSYCCFTSLFILSVGINSENPIHRPGWRRPHGAHPHAGVGWPISSYFISFLFYVFLFILFFSSFIQLLMIQKMDD